MDFSFDVSSLPTEAKVINAVASLYPFSESSTTGNGPKSLMKITSPWDEATATWVVPWNQSGGDFKNTPIATSNFDSILVWEDFDVTDEIKEIVEDDEPNYGFLLKFDNYEDGYETGYHSSNYSEADLRPKLSITYLFDDDEPPVVSISTPNASSVWIEGTNRTIKWNATDNNLIAGSVLYFSSDNGTTWSLIDSISGTTSSYSWTVPNTISTECKVKVISYDFDDNSAMDVSEKFVIDIQTVTINNAMADKINQIKIKKGTKSLSLFIPNQKGLIALSDSKGRMIYSFQINRVNQWHQVPIDITSGIYFLSISTKDVKLNKKFYFLR